MECYEKLVSRKSKLSVIGLGYVGLPLAVAFSKKVDVIGFDLNNIKIDQYKLGNDPTNEVGREGLLKSKVQFTSDKNELKDVCFHIIAVPTPINSDKTPNLEPVISASEIVGESLERGSIVVYESTVYPGVTEDICIPILEKKSGLKHGKDFKVGYSPERINPGDKVHKLESIVKIVSGCDEHTLEVVAKVYELIISAGVHRARTIKIAEAAKVVENSQRDINIAFMNELAMVFDRMKIDTNEVLRAMNTKWNALGFTPGLVGGHCIGVDPYYFIYEAEKLGYHSQIIASGRKINDGMGKFIAESVIKKLIQSKKVVSDSKVIVLGLTFKENTPDIRNSKVVDVIENLKEYGIFPTVVDPNASVEEAWQHYGIKLENLENINNADCIIMAVPHDDFRRLSLKELDIYFKNMDKHEKILIDIKSVYKYDDLLDSGYSFWRL